MCIDAPESTTNYRSSGLFEVGASIALASTEVSNVAFSPMLLCGRIFLGARFRLVSSPANLGALRLRS